MGHTATPGCQGQLRATLNIRERPAKANVDRAVPGHWEGDLLMGKRMHATATLCERKSRFVMLVVLQDGHTADLVADVLSHRRSPSCPTSSVDRSPGTKAKRWPRTLALIITTDVPVYFVYPRSPWPRGSNENTNGLLRQYFPKRSDIGTTPRPTSTRSPPNSTTVLDKPSTGCHHPKRSTKRCDDHLRPRSYGVVVSRSDSRTCFISRSVWFMPSVRSCALS